MEILTKKVAENFSLLKEIQKWILVFIDHLIWRNKKVVINWYKDMKSVQVIVIFWILDYLPVFTIR